MFDLTQVSIVFTHILFSKFWKMRLSMMVSLVVFVSAPRPSTSDRLTSAFSSRLALRLNTSSSSRPFAPSTAPTWSRSETLRFLGLGLVSARSIVRVTPARLLAVAASSSKISVLTPRLFTSFLTISRAAKASILFCYQGLSRRSDDKTDSLYWVLRIKVYPESLYFWFSSSSIPLQYADSSLTSLHHTIVPFLYCL